MSNPNAVPVRFRFPVALVALVPAPILLQGARFSLSLIDEAAGKDPVVASTDVPVPKLRLTLDEGGQTGLISVDDGDVAAWHQHLGQPLHAEALDAVGQRMVAQMDSVLGEIEGEDEGGGEVVCWPEVDAQRYHPTLYTPAPERRPSP